MALSRSAEELDQLLSESPEQARVRVALQMPLPNKAAIVLYGAGGLGRTTLKKLRRAGLEPVVFADDTAEKQGRLIDGLQVMMPQQAMERFAERLVFVVTIMNPKLRFIDARQRLRILTERPIISFLHLAWQYPETFLPYYQFELPQHVLTKASDIRRALHVFADEESRRQFVAHLRFRLHLDYDALPESSGLNYFPRDLFSRLPDDTVFIDCGAYDGDTVRYFLKQQAGRFRRIYAIEPDEINCRKLRDYVDRLGEKTAQKVNVFNAAVGAARGRISFSATGDMSASFTETGEHTVEVLALQELIKVDEEFVFLKLDVEGAELAALRGAARLLEQARPLLAISVYHRPDDLWQLPLYVADLDLGYRLFLRTQGEDGMDVICYALPPRLSPNQAWDMT